MIDKMKYNRSKSKYLYLIYVIQVLSIQNPSWNIDAFTIGTNRIPRSSIFDNSVEQKRATRTSVTTSSSITHRVGKLHNTSTGTLIHEVDEIEEEKKKRKNNKRTTKNRMKSNRTKSKSNNVVTKASSIKIQPTKKRQRKKDSSVNNAELSTSTTTQQTTIKMNKRGRRQGINGKSTTSASTLRISNLLSREEEIKLTSAIQNLKKVIHIRDELSVCKTINNPGSTPSYLPNPMYKDQHTKLPYKIQPTEQEWAQACNISVVQLRRILVKGRDARRKILDGNAGLVTQIAKKYNNALRKSTSQFDNIGCILTVSDLIQEGNLGLMMAAERFESEKGFRFATYAVHWVRSRILRCIADNSRVIRLPAHVHTTLRTIRKVKSTMEQELGREPTQNELAHRLQMPISKLQLYTDSSLPVVSLEVPLSNGRSSSKSGSGDVDKRTLMDRIASDSPTPQEDAEFDSLRRDIRAAIDSLGCDLEKNVLLNRFGLDDGNPRTVEETAHKMCISRDRVRRIEARALNKLRHPQRNYMLKEYVENTSSSSCEGDIHFHNDDVQRDDFMMNGSKQSNSGDGGNRVTHFGGEDVMNQFTPEMIWSV